MDAEDEVLLESEVNF